MACVPSASVRAVRAPLVEAAAVAPAPGTLMATASRVGRAARYGSLLPAPQPTAREPGTRRTLRMGFLLFTRDRQVIVHLHAPDCLQPAGRAQAAENAGGVGGGSVG